MNPPTGSQRLKAARDAKRTIPVLLRAPPFSCLCLGYLAIEDLIMNRAVWLARHHEFDMFWLYRAKHSERTASERPLMRGHLPVGFLSLKCLSDSHHPTSIQCCMSLSPRKRTTERERERETESVVGGYCLDEFGLGECHGAHKLSRNVGFPSKAQAIPEASLLHGWPHSSWFTVCLPEPWL